MWSPIPQVMFALCVLLTAFARADQTATTARPAAQPLFVSIPPASSGVTMRHPLLADHPRAYLYTSGFACGGVAIGDVSGDERPDLFITSGPDSNRLFVQTEQPFVFRDTTDAAGLGSPAQDNSGPWSAGATMVDVNHDGH